MGLPPIGAFWILLAAAIIWLVMWCADAMLSAVHLNLRVWRGARPFYFWRHGMAKIGDTFTATIKPTNAAGEGAPVTAVVFASDSAAYDVKSVSPDGLSAVFVAVAAGSANVTVTATSKAGVTLTDKAALPGVIVDDEAVALNLVVA